MRITRLLADEHRVAKETINRLYAFSEGEDLAAKSLAGETVQALRIHAVIEERLLYPLLADARGRALELVRTSLADHARMERLLEATDALSGPREGAWKSTLRDLRREIERHVALEEEDLFPAADRILGPARLEELGREAETMRNRLLSGAEDLGEALAAAEAAVPEILVP